MAKPHTRYVLRACLTLSRYHKNAPTWANLEDLGTFPYNLLRKRAYDRIVLYPHPLRKQLPRKKANDVPERRLDGLSTGFVEIVEHPAHLTARRTIACRVQPSATVRPPPELLRLGSGFVSVSVFLARFFLASGPAGARATQQDPGDDYRDNALGHPREQSVERPRWHRDLLSPLKARAETTIKIREGKRERHFRWSDKTRTHTHTHPIQRIMNIITNQEVNAK